MLHFRGQSLTGMTGFLGVAFCGSWKSSLAMAIPNTCWGLVSRRTSSMALFLRLALHLLILKQHGMLQRGGPAADEIQHARTVSSRDFFGTKAYTRVQSSASATRRRV
ncbi:MAG: hypothetical protein ACRD4I_13985, partial [Candidatus Angelobacter sp.]